MKRELAIRLFQQGKLSFGKAREMIALMLLSPLLALIAVLVRLRLGAPSSSANCAPANTASHSPVHPVPNSV